MNDKKRKQDDWDQPSSKTPKMNDRKRKYDDWDQTSSKKMRLVRDNRPSMSTDKSQEAKSPTPNTDKPCEWRVSVPMGPDFKNHKMVIMNEPLYCWQKIQHRVYQSIFVTWLGDAEKVIVKARNNGCDESNTMFKALLERKADLLSRIDPLVVCTLVPPPPVYDHQ